LVISVNFTVDGLSDITSKLTDYSSKVKDFQSSESRDLADKMVQEMQGLAPVDTGYLRDHIMSQDEGDGRASVVSEADYSVYVEFGTRHMAAQPFFFPVFDKYTVQDIADDFRSQVTI